MKRIYLDHNATSPLRPQVKEALEKTLADGLANPSSIHSSGRRVRKAVDEARENVAKLIGANPSEIIFTSGGTEANHLAWHVSQKPGKKIATSTVEHDCVLQAAAQAEKSGAHVSFIPVNQSGQLDWKAFWSKQENSFDLISIQHANNETGVIFDLASITSEIKPRTQTIHTDAVQTVGKIKVDVNELGVDILSLSAHKLGGLSGCGALYVRKGTAFEQLWKGGSQEKGQRTGTENVLGIISMGAAAVHLQNHWEEESQKIKKFRDDMEAYLTKIISGLEITAYNQTRLPNTSHFTFEDVDGESLVIALDLEGIDCSTGSACSSGSLEPSHVLRAMGFSFEKSHGSLRISLGWSTTEKEMDYFAKMFPKLVAQVRSNGKMTA